MAGSDDTVRDALARLLAEHPRATVLDPAALPGLLQPVLTGPAPADDDLVHAAVLAVRTPALRALVERVPGASRDALVRDLRTLGVEFPLAERTTAVWTGALRTAEPTRPVPAAPAAGTPGLAVAPTGPGTPVPPAPVPPAPAAGAPRPAAPAEPVAAATARSLTPPAPPRPTGGARAGELATRPAADRDGATHRQPGHRSRAVVVLAMVTLVAVAVAVLGWIRDPSRDRAVAAETRSAAAETTLQATRDELSATQALVTQRTGELNAAREQITRIGTVALTQVTGARLPQKFALTGKVAPGSCSLTGDACNVTTTVRNVTLSCTGASCDCTNGSCTVTSDLWKTPAPLAFNPGTALYTASGSLDADLFRCAGVPQPTTYQLRLRVTRATWGDGAWVASGLEAELAQASAASDCLAGNRTYALGGPAA
jgi:hypothetical protein